jgi:hypothetical protein
LAVSLAALISCGDDDPTAPEPEEPFPASRSTPDSLLTDWLEKAIAARDLGALDAALSSTFRFQFGPVGIDSLESWGNLLEDSVSWGRARDLSAMDRIFSSRRVTSATMDVRRIRQNAPDSVRAGCRRIEIDTRVSIVFDDGDMWLGGDFRQTYIVGPDPQRTGQWVVEYQIDDQAPYKRRDDSSPRADEAISIPDTWGDIKAIFALGWIQ